MSIDAIDSVEYQEISKVLNAKNYIQPAHLILAESSY